MKRVIHECCNGACVILTIATWHVWRLVATSLRLKYYLVAWV